MSMQKDFQDFIADKSVSNAKKVIRHGNKISAQCVYGNEIREAIEIFNDSILHANCERKA